MDLHDLAEHVVLQAHKELTAVVETMLKDYCTKIVAALRDPKGPVLKNWEVGDGTCTVIPLDCTRDEALLLHYLNVLRHYEGNKTRAARHLSVDPKGLRITLQRHGLHPGVDLSTGSVGLDLKVRTKAGLFGQFDQKSPIRVKDRE